MRADSQSSRTGPSESFPNIEHATLAAAVEQAADSIVMTDIRGTIQYVNPAFTAITGYTIEEAVGKNPRMLKSGRHTREFYKDLWGTIKSGQIWRGELTNRRKDGTIYYEEMRVAPVRGPEGVITGYIAIKRDITQQRAAQQMQAFLAAIVENSEDSIIACTVDGIVSAFNRGAETIFGYSRAEAIGRHMSIFVPPERLTALDRLADKLRRGERFSQYDGWCLRKDGSQFPVSITGFPIKNADGEVVAISNILRDVTERRKVEQNLGLLASIVASSQDAIHSVALDGTILSWNRSSETLFGYSSEEIIGKSAEILAPPGRCDELYRCLEVIRKGEAISPFETTLQDRGGRGIDVKLSVSPTRSPAGEVTGASVIAADLRQHHESERKLRESETRFRSVFEHAPSGMCVTGLDGCFMQVNEALCKMLGYSAEELLGTPWSRLNHPDDLNASVEKAELLIRGQSSYIEDELRHIHRSGHVVWVRVRASLVRDSDGSPLYLVAHVEDITQRKQSEQAAQFQHSLIRAIHAATPDGILVIDNQNTIVSHNKQFLDIWRIPLLTIPDRLPDYAIGDQPPLILSSVLARVKDPDAYLKRIQDFQNKPSTCDHGEIELKDGRTLERTSVGLMSESGECLGRVRFFRDITERKRAEEALRQSEERLRGILDNCPSMLWVTGPTGEVDFLNRAYREFSGLTAEEACGNGWRSQLHPDDAPEYLAKFDRAMREHTSFSAEGRVRHADGEWRLAGSRGEPRFSPDGEYLGHIGLRADITERRRAEQLHEFQHSLIRAIYEGSLDGILVVNPDGIVVSHNKKLRDVWKIPVTEISGGQTESIVGARHEPLLSAVLGRIKDPESYAKRVQAADDNQDAEDRGEFELKDGRTLERYSSCLRNESGQYLGRATFFRDITERKQSEQALQFQHSLTRAINEVSLDGILVVNSEGKITSFNKKLFDIFQIPLSTVLDRPLDAEKGVPDLPLLSSVTKCVKDPDAFLKRVQELYADPNVNDQCEIELKDGRTLERYSTSLRSENGEYLARTWFFRDITERKHAEQALKESEERFRVMADGCPMPMWVTGAEGGIYFINRALLEFTGASGEQVKGDNWQLFSHPDDAEAFFEESRRVVRERVPLKTETRFRRADGEWRWLAIIAEPRFSSSGEFLGHIGLGMDITERKQAEQTLIESENRFRTMADSCPIGIWVSDAQGMTCFVNRTYRVFCGITSEDVDPDLWLSFLHPDDRPAFVEPFERALREHTPFKAENRSRRFDGEWRWIETDAAPRFSADKEFLGFSGTSKDVTERKQAEQASKESEERFRVMADSCPLGIWVSDAQGRTLFANRAYRSFCGIASEDVEQDGWLFLLHPDDAPEFLETFDRAIQEHTRFSGQHRGRRADGQWRWLESYAQPRFSPGGEFLGFVGTSQDIDSRKQAEQALQSSEEKFRELAENISQVFWLKELEADGFLYVSPAYEQVWGRSCASVYQDPNSRLEAIHPDDLAKSRSAFTRQMQGEEVETEFRIRTPDGQEKWIRGRTFPIHDQGGKLIRIAGIAEDITQHKRYEEELIRARADAETANSLLAAQHAVLDNERKILRTFIDNVPDLMFVKDIEGRFVVSNPGLARQAGVEKPEDMLGKTDFDFFPHDLARQFHKDDLRVIRSGQPIFNREETVEASGGKEPRFLLTTKVPVFDSEGRVTGIAGMGRDITSRKAMEDALRETNRELQESIDRANELAFKAEAASRSKSEFLANMSHEIRTPMNGVIGMNGLLLCSNLEAEQRHYAEVIDACAKSLLTVIDDILDYSKVEAGKLEIDTVDFNLHVLMGDFAEMMAERVADKPLEFVCAVAPNVNANLNGDPGRLRQVLQNLVSNAMKFTHRGEVVVRVELISETDNDVWLRFTVRDTGIGIPKDKQEMVFTSFTQVDASTTRQYGGTGLGLTISRKLVELMGGEIGLESKEGEGSTFWFTVPFVKRTPNSQASPNKILVKGTRILVVDDNATNREVLTAQLQSWGAAVVAVESGPTAMACMRYAVTTGAPFQLAVLDMMMPGMDGATLGRAILADDALKSIPLVMMTSLGQRGDAHHFKEIGFAAYLIKPVRQSDLFDCLVNLLTEDRQAKARSLITRHSLQTARRSNARILLVEDNLTNQEVACGMLKRMGWHADLAQDGREALQALELKPYDLVLMDAQMPVMDGYEATRRIRDPQSAVLNHNVPIIATTAHAMAGDAEKCLAAGMSDYISKPIDPKILEEQIVKWLTRSQHEPLAVSPAASAGESNAPMPAAPSTALIFNREKFLERMMGDEEFAQEVAAEFMKELPTLVSALKQHVAHSDLESIWKQAHKIKGSAANVGGEALRDVAMKVEQAGKASNSAEAIQWIPELEIQAAKLIAALQDWQSELGLSKHGSSFKAAS